jgi:Lrp/AsnC family transcriptional regulator of ectoine degradation
MIKLDRTDLKILGTLQRDGRITKLRLAEAVNLSPTACWERLRRLEQARVITGYSVRIDRGKIARESTVLVEVTLKSHTKADFDRFEAAIRDQPEIVTCDATGGGVDYLLRVVTRDVAAYQAFMEDMLAKGLGIDRYFSYVVTKHVKAAEPALGCAVAGDES